MDDTCKHFNNFDSVRDKKYLRKCVLFNSQVIGLAFQESWVLSLVSHGCLGRYLIERGEIQPARTLASFRSRNWKDSFFTSLTYTEIRKLKQQGQSYSMSEGFVIQAKRL